MARKKEADRIQNLFTLADNWTRTQWEYTNQKGYDFANDQQLSNEERKDLREQGMPDFIINRITPVVEMLNYYATANNPRWQGVAVEGSDSDLAAVFSDMSDYIWNLSDGSTLYANTINNTITKSIGYILVNVDPNMDNGKGEVTLESPEPFEIFVDAKSRHMLFRDAAYILIRKLLPKTHLISKFPEFKNKIKKASSNEAGARGFSERDMFNENMTSFQFNDSEMSDYVDPEKAEIDEVVEYFECYEKIKELYYNCEFSVQLSAEQVKALEESLNQRLSAIEEEAAVRRAETEQQLMIAVQNGEMLPERAEFEMKQFDINTKAEIEVQVAQLKAEAQAAMYGTEVHVLSEDEWNAMDDATKGRLLMSIPFYKDRVQLTKIAGDTLLSKEKYPDRITDYPIVPFHWKWTGTPFPMSAVSPLVGKQQEINKTHQILVHNASLGSSLRWVYEEGAVDLDYWEKYSSSPGAMLAVHSGFEPPKEILPMQLSNAFFTLVQEGKADMEYLAGIWSGSMGDTGDQHDTYRGMLALDEYGTRRVRQWMKNFIEPALRQVGILVRDFSQTLYTSEKVFRIVQPSAIQESRETKINVPIYNNMGEAIGKWNDYQAMRVDVRVTAGSTAPINRWAYLGELKEMFQMGVIDDIAFLAETDLRNKEAILERKSLYSQLQQQIQSMEEALKDKDGTIETLERQLIQAGIRHKIDTGAIEVAKAVESTKSEINRELTSTTQQQKLLREVTKEKAKLAEREAKLSAKQSNS